MADFQKGEDMILELKETRPHGTKEYPYDQCFIHNVRHNFQFPVHWHDEFEIIYIIKGSLKISIEDQDYTGKAGAVFLVNPRELHLMGSFDLSVAYYTLLFPLEFISFQSKDKLEQTLLQPLRSGRLLLANEIKDTVLLNKLGNLFDEMVLLNDEKSLCYQLKTRILLLTFLSRIMEQGLFTVPETAGSCTGRQKELLIYIQEHYMEDITLRTLADEFHLSEKYISRYFKEHFCLTFSHYLNHLRLTGAQRLLETTELSVTDIALRSGFSSVSYFIRMFKECYGVSPLKYRKSVYREIK